MASEVLEQIADEVCPTYLTNYFDVYTQPAGATLDCNGFSGHRGRFDIVRYQSADVAEISFGTPEPEEDTYSIGGGLMRELRWVPPCCAHLGGVSTQWMWQRDCWLTGGYTFDDTSYIFSPQGPIVVDALVESGRLDDLLALCPPSP